MDHENLNKGIEDLIIRLIPYFGDAFAGMTPDQKREFILKLSEAIARGLAEGAVRGGLEKQ